MEVTLPGGAIVPTSGVTAVGVLPTHRRRGVLRSLMAPPARRRGRAGRAAGAADGVGGDDLRPVRLRRGLRVPVDRGGSGPGQLRVATGGARRRGPERTGAAAADAGGGDRAGAGVVRRVPPVVAGRGQPAGVVVAGRVRRGGDVEGRRAAVRGRGRGRRRAARRLRDLPGDRRAGPDERRLEVRELVAADPEVPRALWRFLLDVDLVTTIEADVGVDDPLRWRLADFRALRVDRRARLPVGPGRRSGGRPGRPALRARGRAGRRGGRRRSGPTSAGRYAVAGGPDGAVCERHPARPIW